MSRFLLFVSAIISMLSPALADIEDNVWKLASSGDYHAIENLLRDEHALSIETQNYDNVRISNIPFATTDPDVISTVQAWHVDMPESPYAKTALAWINYHIAYQIRGENSARQTHPMARQEFTELMNKGFSLALEANNLAPDFVPASDAVLRTSRGGSSLWDMHKFTRDTMELTPNFGTLYRALQFATPAWGGSIDEMVAICALSSHLDEMSEEECIARAFVIYKPTKPLLRYALEYFYSVHEETEETPLPEFALTGYDYNYFKVPEDKLDYVYDLVLTAAENRRDFDELRNMAQRFSLYHGLSDLLEQEVTDIAYAAAIKRRERDPYSVSDTHIHVRYLLENLTDRDPNSVYTEAFDIWKNSLEFGKYYEQTWLQGGGILRKKDADFSFFTTYPYFVNSVVYSRGSVYSTQALLGELVRGYEHAESNLKGTADPSVRKFANPEAVLEFTQCRMVRAARLLKAYCQRDGKSVMFCRPTVFPMSAANRIKLDLELHAACPNEATSPLGKLEYDPIPVEELDNWTAEVFERTQLQNFEN